MPNGDGGSGGAGGGPPLKRLALVVAVRKGDEKGPGPGLLEELVRKGEPKPPPLLL